MKPRGLPLAIALAALTLPLNALLTWAAGLELHFDEAQYWEWSQRLDWGYYSKGPLIAWLIAAGDALPGEGEWQVRLPGWIAHAATLVAIFLFARQVWNSERAGWWAFALLALTPLYLILSLAMTTDNLMLLFWTLALWAGYRALILERPRAWYGVGAAVGLGALTKLSIGLLPAILGLLVVARRDWRHHLASPHLWLALLLMAALMSPMVIWNAMNDWVTLRHDAGHVSGDGLSLATLAEFIGGQLVALSPPLAVVLLALLWRRPPHPGAALLKTVTLALLAFFLWKALGGKVQVNWAAPAYIGLLVLAAGQIDTLGPGLRRTLRAGLALALLLVALLLFPSAFGLAGDKDPFKKNKYWRAPLAELAQRLPPADFLLTDTYHLAAELAYYWPGRPPVHITGSAGRRFNQHDLWGGLEKERGRSALYIIDRGAPHPDLERAFERCEPATELAVTAPDGAPIRTLRAWHCSGYRHIEWPRPSRY